MGLPRRRPQTKGKVERPFSYRRTNLLNGRTFALAGAPQCRRRDVARRHAPTCARTTKPGADPGAVEEEKPHLLAVAGHAYDTAEVLYRDGGARRHLPYQQNFYSVPWPRIGELLPVRITETELIVYGPERERDRPA